MSDAMNNSTRSMDDQRDDDVFLRQVRAALAPMPTVGRRAIADILTAVAQRKPTRTQRLRMHLDALLDQLRMSTSPLTRGVALASAALAIGFVARGALQSNNAVSAPATSLAQSTNSTTPAPRGTNAAPLQAVGGAVDPAELRVPVQFVLDAQTVRDAVRVSVVGDFNDWDVDATPLARDANVWSVTLPMTQGRHVYAFVVDGTRWIADPRAPEAKDADFGRPASVVLVQAP